MTITAITPGFKQTMLQNTPQTSSQAAVSNVSKQAQTPQKKLTFLEKFHTATKNSADMTDTIVVPRTIFKGYLGIMTGTVLATLGCLSAAKSPKTSKVLSIIGLLTSFYGTYSFVRPYVIKDSPGVDKTKK